MKRLLVFLIGFAGYVIYFSWVEEIFEGKNPITALTGRDLTVFVIKLFLYYIGIVYVAYRWTKEKKIKQAIQLPVPLIVPRLSGVPGFRLPFYCTDPRCKGVIVQTVVNDPHTKADLDGTVLFYTASNKARIAMGLLARYRQIFSRHEKLFCIKCGTEYMNLAVPEKNPLNLYAVLHLLMRDHI